MFVYTFHVHFLIMFLSLWQYSNNIILSHLVLNQSVLHFILFCAFSLFRAVFCNGRKISKDTNNIGSCINFGPNFVQRKDFRPKIHRNATWHLVLDQLESVGAVCFTSLSVPFSTMALVQWTFQNNLCSYHHNLYISTGCPKKMNY